MTSDPSGRSPTDGRVIVFYSFKGGTGRSMALANAAIILGERAARLNEKVLVIDWDLEAPGLHRYFRPYLNRASAGGPDVFDSRPGLLECFTLLRDRVHTVGPAPDEAATRQVIETLPLREFIVETDIPHLSFMKAGQFGDTYAESVAAFDWPALYGRAPAAIRQFAGRLAAEYRYVLIDSRTGLSDTSGICTMLMPEVLVTVFTPNRQSLAGVVDVVTQAATYRARADDLRPLLVYPLPSRIEASEPELRRMWRSGDPQKEITGYQPVFESVFRRIYALESCNLNSYFEAVQIQHVPRYAYGEDIAVMVENNRDVFSLTRSFERFTAILDSGTEPWNVGPLGVADEHPVRVATQPAQNSAAREIDANPYLRRLEAERDDIHAYSKRKSRLNRTFGILAMSASAATVLAAVLLQSGLVNSNVGMWIMVGSGVLSVAATFLVVDGSARRRAARASEIATEITGELERFAKGDEPYNTDAAVARLRDRASDLILAVTQFRSARHAMGPEQRATPTIYISFRRLDTAAAARRLYDDIRSHLAHADILIDVEEPAPGESVDRVIERRMRSVSVALVLIGPNWVAQTAEARHDIASRELATLLARNVIVIPLLIGDARMPAPGELPNELQKLSTLQAFALPESSWDAGVLLLVGQLWRIVGGYRSRGNSADIRM
jgi:Mrp family chromosome partitioning ATPase